MARERSRERSRDNKHKSSKRRSRSRSRSRDRKSRKHSSRDRSRDRSPGRRRDRKSSFSDAEQVQQAQMAIQQQQLQQQMMSQQLLLQQQALMGGAASGKKQREVYVGNLTIGAVTDVMLRELFNGALAHLMPDPQLNPPVINVGMDPSGRFGFVEMRTEELATSGMALDKVELCGRNINVGRPKGYVEPPQGHAPPAQLASAQMFAARLGTGPTRVVLLKNMLKALQLLDEAERTDASLMEDVKEECGKYGTVEGIAVPRPPPTVAADEPSRVYVKFGTPDESSRVKEAFNGRQFDGNSITAAFASEDDFNQAAAGKWTGAAPQAPAAGFMGSPIGGPAPLPAGISGIAALNPATGGMVNPNMAPVLDPATVPFQEGWIKLRGIPFTITKPDICSFFSTCGQMSEDKVKLVVGPDGRPTGEAYVEISGAGAKLRLALAKDRQIMPGSSRYIEIFTSTRDEVDRRALTGVMLV
ncbi:hypothetical protein COCSUDRAFT_64653 [Coccomyxa subellipsoidea C-169]|uniref:RRM domain-containing protein n=1 Tax=Coccomyxa subellipsoidea (strain C-169) TaxID=574566 RepID=I0Z808_COCSC|nr:hypothetical protein COCSUDRAFT_64653 [Coccomyxa subellipsoidea C-169]EIE26777.1 hypothetical protein COCSUDRAFT_64653 [Coccomyxa subellipsoidea C-169]|eukprot:XP_005651321.1 hypothetical protein COCSUDRAFT_64653 [Coccomyxa subellipsoidea C-169]